MPEINVTTGSRLPDADEADAPAISFGEGATIVMLDIIRGMSDWIVQITDEHGSFEAMICSDPIKTNSDGIWSVQYQRDISPDGARDQTWGEPELMPLTRLLRLHVW